MGKPKKKLGVQQNLISPNAALKGVLEFNETEESYTSQASFVDRDELPVYGEKPEGWKPSGRRIKRGLYRAANEWRINADCNGAANIIRKVAMIFGFELEGISRGVLTAPVKTQIWA